MTTHAQTGDQMQSSQRAGVGRRGGFVPSSAPPLEQALVLGPIAMVSAGVLIGIGLLLMATVGAVGVLVVLAAVTLISAGIGMRSS